MKVCLFFIDSKSSLRFARATYWEFIKANGLSEKIQEQMDELHKGKPVDKVGKAIRNLFLKSEFPDEIASSIRNGYGDLCSRYNTDEADVAVRSIATAENLPDASFAGQQETFLNITGDHNLLDACRKCYASLFTDRAITYRKEKGFDHMKVALSVGVQKMVRSDKSGSGVIFTLDTETGFPDIVLINASWGLGEKKASIVKSVDEIDKFEEGNILVTEMTDPDWVTIMKKAAGIIPEPGQRDRCYQKGGRN